jgi:hypothetical protein
LTYFASTRIDTLGDDGAANGHIVDWEILNSLENLYGDLTTTDGVSLFGTVAGQLTCCDPFSTDNPIAVLRVVWLPDLPGEYDVEYHTESESVADRIDEAIDVWVGPDNASLNRETWPVAEAQISFAVAGQCYADFNTDGDLNILDFVAFQQAWKNADPTADCNADADFDILDFVCFQSAFKKGCK